MKPYAAEIRTVSVQNARRSPVLLSLRRGMILCAGVAAAASFFDSRLTVGALGAAMFLLGSLCILAGRKPAVLTIGIVIALAGGFADAWTVYRLLSHQPLGCVTDSRELTVLIELGLLLVGILCIVQPLGNIRRAVSVCTQRVAARCVSAIPEQDAIVWRYGWNGEVYDFEERRCVSFFLPHMGDTCILYISPEHPCRAVRIDRWMTAVQVLLGVLLSAEMLAAMVN